MTELAGTVTVTVPKGRIAWLEERRLGIQASDAPVILGLAPWSSPYKLWLDKTGKLPIEEEAEPSLRLRMGHAAEPEIATEFATRRNVTLYDLGDYAIVRSTEHPHLGATFDRLLVDDPALAPRGRAYWTAPVEFKTVAGNREEWTDTEPSAYALVQLTHQMIVGNFDHGYIAAALDFGAGYLDYEIPVNDDLRDLLLEEEYRFWQLVKSDTPPAVDGSTATRQALRALYPQDSGREIELAGEEWGRKLEAWRAAKEKVAEAEAERDRLVAEFQAAMGDATKAIIPGVGALSWKTASRKGYYVQPSTTRTFREVKL